MKITELVVGAPCTIDQGLSAYFYSFHRFVGELNSVDMRIVQSQTDSDSNVIVQRKYSLSKTFFPIWAQALASSGLDAVETCSANVKNRSIISGFECPAFGNRLFVDVVTRFATAPNISNVKTTQMINSAICLLASDTLLWEEMIALFFANISQTPKN
uniref:Uncharacterized protein n=1 Tax=Spongospora subterranea TaxID=70186 RepID=A0A0H5QQA1_9EUKA|eukprot:CRZ03636.1 hypothetical protein [Spongospora subterranea]